MSSSSSPVKRFKADTKSEASEWQLPHVPVPGLAVVDHLNEKHVDQLVKLYQEVWWTRDRNKERVAKMLKYTTVVLGLVEVSTDDLIGFVRARGDAVFNAVVSDVIVREDRQKKGLGSYLMDLILSHPLVKDCERIDLYGKPDVRRFYEKKGFGKVIHVDHMRYRSNCFDKLADPLDPLPSQTR